MHNIYHKILDKRLLEEKCESSGGALMRLKAPGTYAAVDRGVAHLCIVVGDDVLRGLLLRDVVRGASLRVLQDLLGAKLEAPILMIYRYTSSFVMHSENPFMFDKLVNACDKTY